MRFWHISCWVFNSISHKNWSNLLIQDEDQQVDPLYFHPSSLFHPHYAMQHYHWKEKAILKTTWNHGPRPKLIAHDIWFQNQISNHKSDALHSLIVFRVGVFRFAIWLVRKGWWKQDELGDSNKPTFLNTAENSSQYDAATGMLDGWNSGLGCERLTWISPLNSQATVAKSLNPGLICS